VGFNNKKYTYLRKKPPGRPGSARTVDLARIMNISSMKKDALLPFQNGKVFAEMKKPT
jgi:hypothetical protein